MHIREARPADAATLARLNISVHRLHTAARPTLFKEPVVEELTIHMLERLQQADCVIFIAEVEGVPVGYTINMIIRREANPFSPAREYIMVDNISVEPEYRSQGIGESLMARVYALARTEGIERVVLAVWAFNQRAIAFYERLGFAPYQVYMEKVLD